MASRAGYYPGVRVSSVRSAGKGVQHRFLAGGIQFEHHARITCAAGVGGPIQITGSVEDDAGVGLATIGASREVVEHDLVARRVQLEHHASIGRPAAGGSAV